MGAAGIEPESPPALQNTQVQADSSLCNRTAGRNSDQTWGGGTLGISGWRCAAGTMEPLTYTRASSAEFC